MIYQFINLIKALASCLVVNSHFDGIWPISTLATGGSLGNCLFFAASGFLLGNIKQDFIPWYLRKLARIYPAVWIITTISLFFRDGLNAGQIAREYLILSNYWFLQALVVLYVPFYFVMKGKLKNKLSLVVCSVCIIYFLCYFCFKDIHIWTIEDGSRFKWLFYFIIFLMGGGVFFTHQLQPENTGKTCPWMACAYLNYRFLCIQIYP